MIEIKKVTISKLEKFINSDEFLNFNDIPVSTIRAISYINNPNARAEDAVVYMAIQDKQLAGLATLWRDEFYDGNTTKSFGWMSGNWVHENQRRKGITTKLFNEVYKDWDGELLYTNYSSDAFLFFDRTGLFEELNQLKGTQFYTRFSLATILPNKKKVFTKTRLLWKVLDGTGNFFLNFISSVSSKKKTTLKARKNEIWNDDIRSFITSFKKDELFKKQEKNFRWAIEYPWVNDSEIAKKEDKKYYFSVFSNNFKNNYYTLYNSKNEVVAVVWMNFREGHLKIPYVYVNESYIEELANFIVLKSSELKTKTIVVCHASLEKVLTKKLSFVFKKEFIQKYFATKKLLSSHPNMKNKLIQSGDGDVIFT